MCAGEILAIAGVPEEVCDAAAPAAPPAGVVPGLSRGCPAAPPAGVVPGLSCITRGII